MMAHPEIASTSEPWFLIPLFYTRKIQGVASEYSHTTCYYAINDFIEELPDKEDDYRRSIRNMANDLYQKQCYRGEKYFLDKTPRYHLIVDEIAQTFPAARLIFLFRNPIHTIASQIKTFCNNRLGPYHRFHIDQLSGFASLSGGYERYADRAIKINYEDLVDDTEGQMRRLFSYLEIPWQGQVLQDFQQQLEGQRIGDPTGRKAYKTVSKVSLNKWRETMNTPVRKRFLRHYIQLLDAEDMAIQGYDKGEVLAELASLSVLPFKGIVQDNLDLVYSHLLRTLNLNLLLTGGQTQWARDWYLN